MALSFLLLQKSNRLQQILFCGPDFCGKTEGPEQQQEAEVPLGSVRIAPEKRAGSSPLPQTAAELLPWRTLCLLRRKVFPVASLVLPSLWAAACPANPSRVLKGSLLHSMEHHFSPSLPLGSGGCHSLLPGRDCRLQFLDLQCHRVVQKLQVMFGRFWWCPCCGEPLTSFKHRLNIFQTMVLHPLIREMK